MITEEMHITELRIRNFRNFLKAKFKFLPGVNTLVGENGSGKTNVLHALRLLLDESLARNALFLRESDFCRQLDDWRGQWIVVSADFAALDPSEGCQLLKHNAGHMDGTDSGTCTFFFRPKGEVRKKLKDLSDDKGDLIEYLKSITLDDYEPVITGRACGDFLDDEVYNRWVGSVVDSEFPNPENDDQDVLGVKITSIHQEIACTFVRALRDAVQELRSYRGNPLLTLLRGLENSIKLADSDRIVGSVVELNKDISSLEEIKKLSSGIEQALENAVGQTFAPGVTIQSALPDSIENLLQRLRVLVGDTKKSNYRGELHEQSLGGANLIYLALKLLEYELKLSSDRVAHFLLIEEPEAHIHTHVQKTLFSKLPSGRTQVIVSTHSTHISSVARIGSVNVLAREDGYAEVFQPAAGLTPKQVVRVERYLDALRSTLLFAKGVLLVEGDAEQIMIPAMLKAVFGMNPDELGFSVIAMNSAFFEHVAVIFGDDRIMRPCAIISDLDAPIIELPQNPKDDSPTQSHARASAESGLLRKQATEAIAKGNSWIFPFFGDHTFEVDFLAADNSWEVTQILEDVFSQEAAIKRCKKKLESKDIEVSGTEVLRIANKLGKGWFALLLAEQLFYRTNIPEKIMRAVAFACHRSVSDRVLKQIGLFRMTEERNEVSSGAENNRILPSFEDVKNLNSEEFVQAYIASAPDDALSRFCSYLHEYRSYGTPES